MDVDAITDPVLRDATIAQINNFGQTPTKLFDKPHPKKTVNSLSFVNFRSFYPYLHVIYSVFYFFYPRFIFLELFF